ncbi:glycoside hydrolase family 76 protein [Bacteroidales bacterium OttesenSCG-928-A17]|nr:glycoside hydrolase family 76 protein [Bacteroidales bacterium OttesenSCG-928-A17]
MKKLFIITIYILCFSLSMGACSDPGNDIVPEPEPIVPEKPITPVPDPVQVELPALAEQNLIRSVELLDNAMAAFLTGEGMIMSKNYNPYTGTKTDTESIWGYTTIIESINVVMEALKAFKEYGNSELYDEHFSRYSDLLSKLYSNAAYYKGSFTLTSYTQTKRWAVYAVPRGTVKGEANVAGSDNKKNVYDDQQWLVRELLKAYKLTNDIVYLYEAEYLTGYVLDGWDCTLDANGNENGGITWGPGYTSKHACSNGPFISPLVWLSELYKDKDDEIEYLYITTDKSRVKGTMKKSDYYLIYAKKVYDWQKDNLLLSSGVYNDMRGGGGAVSYETINGVQYRKHANLPSNAGPPITYNSGTMLSGAADLYRVTGDNTYLNDAKALSDASFNYFAELGSKVAGYYTYDLSGHRNWFNGVLMRGYLDVYPSYNKVENYIDSFQKNLDYGYGKFLYKGFLPSDLLLGWSDKESENNVRGMFAFAFASEYALLARYELDKENK